MHKERPQPDVSLRLSPQREDALKTTNSGRPATFATELARFQSKRSRDRRQEIDGATAVKEIKSDQQ